MKKRYFYIKTFVLGKNCECRYEEMQHLKDLGALSIQLFSNGKNLDSKVFFSNSYFLMMLFVQIKKRIIMLFKKPRVTRRATSYKASHELQGEPRVSRRDLFQRTWRSDLCWKNIHKIKEKQKCYPHFKSRHNWVL